MAKVVKKSNLCVVTRTYQDQNGQNKNVWQRIGELTTFQKDDGSYSSIVELYHMPGVTVSVFEQKPKEQQQQAPQQQNQQPPQQEQAQPVEKEINVEDIPY